MPVECVCVCAKSCQLFIEILDYFVFAAKLIKQFTWIPSIFFKASVDFKSRLVTQFPSATRTTQNYINPK